jgi:hypothetical protein
MKRILVFEYERQLMTPEVKARCEERGEQILSVKEFLLGTDPDEVREVMDRLITREKFDLFLVPGSREDILRAMEVTHAETTIVVIEMDPSVPLQIKFFEMGFRHIFSIRAARLHLTRYGAEIPQ